jgi:hypothetical protein
MKIDPSTAIRSFNVFSKTADVKVYVENKLITEKHLSKYNRFLLISEYNNGFVSAKITNEDLNFY